MNVVIYMFNGPLFVQAESDTNETSEWLMNAMEKNSLAVFKTPDGKIQSVVRGSCILGFSFEEPQMMGPGLGDKQKIASLHRRRLEAEVETMERNLKRLREGDEWKDGSSF